LSSRSSIVASGWASPRRDCSSRPCNSRRSCCQRASR
jgi:hypothetical protein